MIHSFSIWVLLVIMRRWIVSSCLIVAPTISGVVVWYERNQQWDYKVCNVYEEPVDWCEEYSFSVSMLAWFFSFESIMMDRCFFAGIMSDIGAIDIVFCTTTGLISDNVKFIYINKILLLLWKKQICARKILTKN